MRFTTLFAAACCVASLAGTLSAQNCKQILGAWKEIPSQQSGFGMMVESEPPNVKISACMPDGTCGHAAMLVKYDGKKYKAPPEMATYLSYRKINEHTIEEKDWVGDGSILRETDTWTVAPDGKTASVKIEYGPSKAVSNHVLIRKGDDPKSEKDPFVGRWMEDPTKGTPFMETFKATADGIQATSNTGFKALFKCDGMDHVLETEGESVNVRQDGDTTVVQYKAAGKATMSFIHTLSADGKTRVATVKGPNGEDYGKRTFERMR
jgi:hypothetical protein